MFLLDGFQGADGGDDVAGFGLFAAAEGYASRSLLRARLGAG
jgi:hypothetical protein